MFISRTFIFPKLAVLSAVTLLFAGVSATVLAEPIQFSNENPKPKAEAPALEKSKTLKFLRPYRPSNPFSESISLKSPSVTPAAPQPGSAPTNKRDDELLDRRRNWIFALPNDEKKSGLADETFGVNGTTLGDAKSKGVVNRFLTDKREKGSIAADGKKEKELGQPIFGLGSEKETESKKGNLSQQEMRVREFSSSTAGQSKLSEFWREQQGSNAERLREEKQTRMKEFESLFGSPSSGTKSSGANLLDGQNNLGLQAATPSRASDRFNGNASSGSSDLFKTAPNSALGVSTAPRPDVNARVFGASAPKASVPEPAKPVRQPAVLSIPKRRF